MIRASWVDAVLVRDHLPELSEKSSYVEKDTRSTKDKRYSLLFCFTQLRTSWLKYLENILMERGTNLKEVDDIEVYTESYGENQICKNVLLADRT